MSKIIKRLLIFFVISFAFLSASIFIFINEPFVQNFIVKYANAHYLNKNGVKLTTGHISYNLFFRTISIENLRIDDVEHPQLTHPLLTTQKISFQLNLISSYVKNRFVLDSLQIAQSHIIIEYDANGNLILPSSLIVPPNPSDTPEPLILENYIDYLPSKTVFTNTNIQIGNKTLHNYHDVFIKQISLIKHRKLFANTAHIEIATTLENSQFIFPLLESPINLENSTANGIVYHDGKIEFSNIHIKSDAINFDGNVSVLLKTPLMFSEYQVNVQKSEVTAKNLFDALGIPADGKIILTGQLKSNALSNPPQFTGNVQWQDLVLDKFNIFNGHAKLNLTNKVLYYENAEISLPHNGKLFASGEYQFYDEFYFENHVTGKAIPLKILLDAVRAKQDVIDGTLDTEKLLASGHLKKIITAKQKDKYDIIIAGPINVSNLHLIPLNTDTHKSLPKMLVDLKILISNNGLIFDNSTGYLLNKLGERTGTLEVKNSRLVLSPKQDVMSMDLVGKNLDFAFLEYFISKKTTGNLNFTGKFTYNVGSAGLQFKSQISAENGSIDNIPFTNVRGNFALFKEYGEISNLIFEIPQKNITQSTFLNLNYLSFRYKDMYSKLMVNIRGNLGNILHLIKNRIPKTFQNFDGTINELSLNLSGYLLHAKTWKFTLNTEITPLITPRGTLSTFSAHLQCAAEECTESKILLEGFDTPQESSALVLLYDVSAQKSNLAFQFQNVPIEFFNYTDTNITGNLYGLGQLQGTWQKPLGDVDVSVDHFSINAKDMGELHAQYNSNDQNNPQIDLTAFDNQIIMSLRLPFHDQSKNANVDLIFANFDAGRILPSGSPWNNTIYSRINASFTLSGKWNPNFKNNLEFLKSWHGKGTINDSELQISSASLNIKTPHEILLQNGVMTVDKLLISSDFASIILNGDYDFSTTRIFLHSIVKINLDNLHTNFYAITESQGKVDGEFRITGNLHNPQFSGYMNIAAKKMALRGDSPAYTDVDGYILLNDTIVEIQKLNAKKGPGNISLTGTFDFKNLDEKNFSYPITNLHLVTRNAPFQLPIPIFRTIDFTLNTDLTLNGKNPPFLLTGLVEVKKLSVFRDLTCAEIYAEYKNLPKVESDLSAIPWANLNVNLQAFNSISIQSNCIRGRFSTTENMNIVGNTNFPLLDGGLETENAIFSILKARFNVKKSSFIFSEKYKFDPFVDISMNARIASYDIYWDVNGRLSAARLNLTAEPQYLPNGNPINQGAILFMITTGQLPTQDSVNTLLATSSGLYSYVGANNNFTNVIDQTLSAVTGGLFDTLSISPLNRSGEVGVRLVASRYFSQRFSFGVSFESGQSLSTSSIFFYYLLNRHVGFTGAYSRSNINTQTGSSINDLSGGLRFNFGTN